MVLLDGPVNATWAAQHLDEWSRQGIGGFLLHGIQDDLGEDGPDAERAAGLTQEIRLACDRLSEGKLASCFVRTVFPADRSPFLDTKLADDLVSRFGKLAAIADDAGLRGIALDTCSANLYYDYRWDGYAYEDYSVEALETAAERMGARLIRSALRGNRELDLLVFAEDYRSWSPLWLALLRGMADAIGRDRGATLHLVSREAVAITDPLEMSRTQDRTRRLLADFVREDFSLGFAVCPVTRNRPPMAIESFRRQMAMAKVLSDRYVVVEDPDACWWQMADADAITHSSLLQNGGACRSQTAAPPEGMASYTATTPFDDYLRAGSIDALGAPGFVFTRGKESALLLWNGVPAGGTLSALPPPVTMTWLSSGKQTELPSENDSVTVPVTTEMVLIEPLPAWEWSVPAGLWFEASGPLSPSSLETGIRFGFAERAGTELSGALDLVPEGDLVVRPAHHDLDLPEQGSIVIDGLLRSPSALSRDRGVSLVLSTPGRGSVTRHFTVPTGPDLVRMWQLDGTVAGGLVAARVGQGWDAFASTDRGEVARLNLDGGVRWRRRFPSDFETAPAVGLDASRGLRLAVGDTSGRVRTLLDTGYVAWETTVESPAGVQALVFAQLDDAPGDELVCVTEGGVVTGLSDAGAPLWRFETARGAHYLTAGPGGLGEVKDVFLVYATARGGMIERISGDQRVWRDLLTGAPACGAVMGDVDHDGVDEAVTLTATGSLQVWDSASGDIKAMSPASVVPGAVGFAVAGRGYVVATTLGLIRLDTDFAELWRYNAPVSAPPVVLDRGSGEEQYLCPCTDGTLRCLDGEGAEVWRDSRAAAPLGAPTTISSPLLHSPLILTPSADRRIRAVEPW